MTVTVVVADDHDGYRDAIETVLRASPGVSLIGSARDGAGAVAMVARLHPQVVVIDLVMPGMTGVDATRRILGGSEPPAVVAISASRTLMREARAAGAAATLLKDVEPAELLSAIRAAAADRRPPG
jgi:DNA-binding NarL/FixJ family response regulator